LTDNSDDTWVYLSTNGVVAKDSGYAATGGVARDRDGNWIMGFNRFLGVCSPFEVEVWGILNETLILFNKGYRRIIIMTDNLEIAQILTDMDLEDSEIIVLRRTHRILLCFEELIASCNQKGSGGLSISQEIRIW